MNQKEYIKSLSNFVIESQIISNLETYRNNSRLDPSRYNQESIKMHNHLQLQPYPSKKICELDEFEESFLPNRFSRKYLNTDRNGTPLLGTSSMLMTQLPTNSRICVKSIRNYSKLFIKEGDILISRSGTVGTSVLCGNSYSQFIGSDDCIRLRLKKSIRGYVAAYLASPFGLTFLIRDSHGKVIKHLKEYDPCNVEIPLLKDEIKAHYIRSRI